MARPDLMALTTDDLITLANAGLVKRAQREVESGELTYTLAEEADGTVKADWSDDVECVLPGGKTLSQARCSCPAISLCRHLLRSVLVYQKEHATTKAVPTPVTVEQPEAATPAQTEPEKPETPTQPTVGESHHSWNPGEIDDETLAGIFKKNVLSQARQRFEQGQVMLLATGQKPSALIYSLGCTVRFLVEGDARYTYCDCNEEAPCSHVPLAVWGFRLLPENQPGGLVSTRAEKLPVPTKLLDEFEQRLSELIVTGLSGLPNSLRDHLAHLETLCRADGLVWPAEIVADFLSQLERYRSHDARFSPEETAALLGELLIRLAAIRSDTGAIPSLFVRGAATDRLTELGSARLVGLGCGARLLKRGAELTAFMQDSSSGVVVAVRREFEKADPQAPQTPFLQLARTTQSKNITLAELGSGQLLIKGAKRSPNYELRLGRAAAVHNPQTYQWENLRQPLLAETFAEVKARQVGLPLAALRPRRLTENFQVCKVAAVNEVRFSATYQSLFVRLADAEGGEATIVHPYTTPGETGFEALMAALNDQSQTLKFVAGTIQGSGGELVLHPVGLVFERDGRREILQPWIAPAPKNAGNSLINHNEVTWSGESQPKDSAQAYFEQILTAIGELLVVGVDRADRQLVQFWQELLRQGQVRGFSRSLEPLERLAAALARKNDRLEWSGEQAAGALLDLMLLVRLAQEELE